MRSTKNVDKPNSWLAKLLGAELPEEEGQVLLNGQRFLMRNGILRSCAVHSTTQQQTSQVFGFKWHQEDTYDSEQMRRHITEWTSKYGDMLAMVRRIGTANRPIVLDAGCGSGVTGFELFGPVMSHINYLGVDVSNAVDVAQSRARRLQLTNVQFMQADLLDIPLADESVDLIY